MSASIGPLSLGEFLVWERAQPLRYEFDGIQPIAMHGGSPQHERLIARIITAAGNRLTPPCEVFGSGLKVEGLARIRCPDVTIACATIDDASERVARVIFEVLRPRRSFSKKSKKRPSRR